MKRIIIIAIAIFVPVMASATTVVPTLLNTGDKFAATNLRLYDLEVAVAELQTQNAALQSKVNLMQAQGGTSAATTNTTGNTASLEARVSALENITKAIQQSLVYVVQLLTDAINKASGR